MYNKIIFIKSSYKINKKLNKNIEISFIGKSNSGKSSVINAITNTNISITSNTPGKTKTINFFKIKRNYYFTDTPGYGYSKLKKKTLYNIKNLLKNYIISRKSLTGIILLISSNNFFKTLDYKIIKSIKQKTHILITKCDKISKKKENKLIKNTKIYLKKTNITFQIFSIKEKFLINKLKIKIKQFIHL
ncbi:MAG TPA: ribosome biogenesis GTP-binding protein YihA/YsxC [Candidatus Azosocius sp. HAIN]